MSDVEDAVIEEEKGDELGDLPSSSPREVLGRVKSRPKLLSRFSLVSAPKEYTSNEALNFPSFDVIKETTKFGIKKRQKRYVW